LVNAPSLRLLKNHSRFNEATCYVANTRASVWFFGLKRTIVITARQVVSGDEALPEVEAQAGAGPAAQNVS